MNNNYIYRRAIIEDIDFLITSIIEAEKSGSEILSYSRIFNLSETEIRETFKKMFLEEEEDSEFYYKNYIVAEYKGKPIGTIGAWVENEESPSGITKGNLLQYYLPKGCLLNSIENLGIVADLNIDHLIGTLSLVVVYIDKEHRGRGLFKSLAEAHINDNSDIDTLSIQVMANNTVAIKSYKKYGFTDFKEVTSNKEAILNLLPYNKKILLTKKIN